jgi:hypothetical protein
MMVIFFGVKRPVLNGMRRGFRIFVVGDFTYSFVVITRLRSLKIPPFTTQFLVSGWIVDWVSG